MVAGESPTLVVLTLLLLFFFGILFIFFNLAGLLDCFFPQQNFAHGYFEMVKFIIQVITK